MADLRTITALKQAIRNTIRTGVTGGILPGDHADRMDDIIDTVVAMIPDLTNYRTQSQITDAINNALASYSTTAQVNTAISNAVAGFIAASAVEDFAKTASSTNVPDAKIPQVIARVSQLVTVRIGSAVPNNNTGRDGDIYFRFQTSTITVYSRQANVYSIRFTFNAGSGGGGTDGTDGRNGDINRFVYRVAPIGATPPADPQAGSPTYTESTGSVTFGSLASGWGNTYPLTAPDFTTQTLWAAVVTVRFPTAGSNAISVVGETDPFPLSPVRLGSGSTPAQATETTAGIAAIATQSETTTGTNDTKFVTPLKLQQKIDAIPSGGGGSGSGDGFVEQDEVHSQSVSTTGTRAFADTGYTIPDDGEDYFTLGINTGRSTRDYTANELRALPVRTVGNTSAGTAIGFAFGATTEVLDNIQFARTSANNLLVSTARAGGETFTVNLYKRRTAGAGSVQYYTASGTAQNVKVGDMVRNGNNLYVAFAAVNGVTTSTDFTSASWTLINGQGGTPPTPTGDFTFGWRDGTSGAFTELANRMNGQPFDVDPVIASGVTGLTFRVPSTHQITNIQAGLGGVFGSNQISQWTASTSGGFSNYTRAGLLDGNYSFRVTATAR